MRTIDPFAMLRFLDDARLTPYQNRLLQHYWRRGECWEPLRTTAEVCNMSLGKASETRQWLLDNDFVEWSPTRSGKMGIVVSVRVANICNNVDVDVHYTNEDNNECSPDETFVHDTNADVHHVNAILNNKVNNKEEEPPPYPPNGNGLGVEEAELPESDYRLVVKVYEQEIGMITRHVSERIEVALEEFSAAALVEAIKLASENNVRRWSYVDGILGRWRTEGRGKLPAPPKRISILDENGRPIKEVTV